MSGQLRFDFQVLESAEGAYLARIFGEVAQALERIAWNENMHWDDRHAARDAAVGIRYLMEPPEREIVRYSRPSYERRVSDE